MIVRLGMFSLVLKNIKSFLKKLSPEQKKIIAGILFFIVFIEYPLLVFQKEGKSFSITGDDISFQKEKRLPKSPFSGAFCARDGKRAIGVVFAEYPETMPLSGLSQADIVIEGPVANANGVNRLFAIFQCHLPKEVGSIRSVRPYVVDLALGFDSVLTSWGGANQAVDRIDLLNIDWLDGRANPSGAFFRKINIPAPHNGFASLSGLKRAVDNLNIRAANQFKGYKFLSDDEIVYSAKKQSVEINDYLYPVKYIYNFKTGDYLRFWNGSEMIDRNTGRQISVKNLVIMKTNIGVFSPGVVDIKIIGTGKAKIFQAGKEIKGTWEKKSAKDKLTFFSDKGKEIKFIPGQIWIEIVSEF